MKATKAQLNEIKKLRAIRDNAGKTIDNKIAECELEAKPKMRKIRETQCAKKMHLVENFTNRKSSPPGAGDTGWSCLRCETYLLDPFHGWLGRETVEGVIEHGTKKILVKPHE